MIDACNVGGGWEDFGPKFAQVNITTDSFLGHYPHLYFIMLLGYVSTSEAHEHDHPSLVDVARAFVPPELLASVDMAGAGSLPPSDHSIWAFHPPPPMLAAGSGGMGLIACLLLLPLRSLVASQIEDTTVRPAGLNAVRMQSECTSSSNAVRMQSECSPNVVRM